MIIDTSDALPDEKDVPFKIFHELMPNKVKRILLVSSLYDAFIMEEDGRLAERIIHEYKGLNLSSPPALTWVSSAEETLSTLASNKFDLVIAMPHISDMEPFALCRIVKEKYPLLPIFFLAHDIAEIDFLTRTICKSPIDRIFVWMGNTELLLALIKNSEDLMNVKNDTEKAKVRVIIFVEDSPLYRSSLLSLLYKEIVMQTQAVMDGSINEEHRILRMRARPKLLIAETYEEAEALYRKYASYLLCVISDVRFPRNGEIDELAGFRLLSMIREERPELPLCMLSSEGTNNLKASEIKAAFLNKNALSLHGDIRYFFIRNLGFGDFVFRMPNGMVLARASNLRTLGSILPTISEKSVFFHAARNDFSTWLMARSEFKLADKLKDVRVSDFKDEKEVKEYLISVFRKKLIGQQRGQIADFVSDDYGSYSAFVKMGRGSLGGKARGLAFISTQLSQNDRIHKKFKEIEIGVPKTIVISTEGFDAFIEENHLKDFSPDELPDKKIEEIFLEASFPSWLASDLKHILEKLYFPLAVRSSSLLEDGYFRPAAGAYNTYMIPNEHPDITVRLNQLISAVKLVFASTYLEMPRKYAEAEFSRTGEDKMAVIIQQLGGNRYGDYFYPAVSGVAQSYNYYPLSYMKPEEGICYISLGLGKAVVEGYSSLRFSPKYPESLPQFSNVDSILDLSQKYFFALDLKNFPETISCSDDLELTRVEIDDALDDEPVKLFSSTYYPDDHKIRDTFNKKGYPVLTFSNLLKHSKMQVPEIIQEILELGKKGMGCPVEIEFAVNLPPEKTGLPEFQILQIRPMASQHQIQGIHISEADKENAFCYSANAMGRSGVTDVSDIVFVKLDTFDSSKTVEIASEISSMNVMLEKEKRPYILAGPGRWGSSDRFLGIPVSWKDISGVACIIESFSSQLRADPSYGTHFFHNLTSLGISYFTISENGKDFFDWIFLNQLSIVSETGYIRHVRCDIPVQIKIDGGKQSAVILKNKA